MSRVADLQGTDFGPRFGRLVRSYRDDLGLSARALALLVWDDAGRKATISRLENGHILRPEAKTVQAISHALDIPPEEIEALRLVSGGQTTVLPGGLETIARTGRDQLEALAYRFEIDRVYDRSDSELRKLLEWKAEEYRIYRRVIDGAESLSILDGETHALAKDAAHSMDFEAVDGLLAKMDQAQSELTMEIKEKRATSALLRGRVNEAFHILTSAAEVMRSIDRSKVAHHRNRYHKWLYDHGLRYPGAGLALAISIQRPAVAEADENGDRSDWARYLQNLGNALANLGARTDGSKGVVLIDEAIDAYRSVLRYFTRQERPKEWGMAQHNLGAALYLRASRTEDQEQQAVCFADAVRVFRSALEVRRRETHPELWAMTLQNLAVALKEQGRITPSLDGRHLIQEGIHALLEALSVRTLEANAMEWAMTQENLALAEYALAEHSATSRPEQHYRAALNHVNKALEIYRPTNSPFYFEKATALRERLVELT